MKIYLDNCCYNRPYDDQTQISISLETQAKLYVQDLIKRRKIEKFDYTKWQRQRFDSMHSDEFNEAAVAYSKENPFSKKG